MPTHQPFIYRYSINILRVQNEWTNMDMDQP